MLSRSHMQCIWVDKLCNLNCCKWMNTTHHNGHCAKHRIWTFNVALTVYVTFHARHLKSFFSLLFEYFPFFRTVSALCCILTLQQHQMKEKKSYIVYGILLIFVFEIIEILPLLNREKWKFNAIKIKFKCRCTFQRHFQTLIID